MNGLLMLFYLILPPQATVICSLWLYHAATLVDLKAACPEGITLENYQVQFINWKTSETLCIKNATVIYAPENCNLPGRLDDYRMVIVKPAENEQLLCSVQSYNNPPSRSEWGRVCNFAAMIALDQRTAEVRPMGPATQPEQPAPVTLPEVQTGPGLYDQVSNAAELATDDQLAWLQNRLVWYAQKSDVHTWQNMFDADIYSAAIAEDVPARLLKRVIKYESQFWPAWGNRPAGEIGMAQITTAAADQYLRWYDPAYPSASTPVQEQMQAAFLKSLQCEVCSLEQDIEQERANILVYARILKAYRYGSDDWAGALKLWNGEDYMRKVENDG